jgi:hypothetical protein
MKLLNEYLIKDPKDMKSDEKSCYFKLNILPRVGCLEAKLYFEDYYYEGEQTKAKMVLKNVGVEKISKIYISCDE